MDPLVVYIVAAALAVILLIGSWDKWRHFTLFEGAVLAYRLVPESLSKGFAVMFAGAELLAAVLLLVPQTRSEGGWLALAVIALATAGVSVNLLRGHTDVACGCGSLTEQSAGLSWWLVVRNSLLMVLLLGMLLPLNEAAQRPLGWIDGLTFFGATLAFLGLYYAVNQLIESHVKLQKLKEI